MLEHAFFLDFVFDLRLVWFFVCLFGFYLDRTGSFTNCFAFGFVCLFFLKKLFIYISVLFLSFNCNRVAVFRAIVLCIYTPLFLL